MWIEGDFRMVGRLERESLDPFLPTFPPFLLRLFSGYPLGFLGFFPFEFFLAFIEFFLSNVD